MVSSYKLSERVSPQSILWDICRAMAGASRLCGAVVSHGHLILSHIDLNTLLLALLIVAGAAGLGAVVAVIVANPVIIVGAGIVAAFGWATYPRAKVAHYVQR